MGSLAAALVEAQKDMPAVEPDKTNPHFGNAFVSLDHLIAKTLPVLNRHGLAISQSPSMIDGYGPGLTTTILHAESGESLKETMPLHLTKQDMQGLGAAITYARRFAWASLLGICGEEDDDGEAASAPAPEPFAGAIQSAPKVSQPVGGQKGAGAASSPAPANTVQAKDGEFAGPVIEHEIGNGYGLAGEIDAAPGGKNYAGKQVRDLTDGQLKWLAGLFAPEGRDPWTPKTPAQYLLRRAVEAYRENKDATILLAEPDAEPDPDSDIPF